MCPLRFRNDPNRHTEFICCINQPIDKIASVTGCFSLELGEWLALCLGDIEHRCGSEPNKSFRPSLGRCLVIVTVTALVVTRRILAFWALFRNDWYPNPDRAFSLLDVPVKILLPCPIARHAGRLGSLAFDEERISVGIVVEPTLDIKPLLELRAGLRFIDTGDEVVDPLFDRAVHLIVSGVALLEGNRRLTSSHDFHHDASCFFRTRRTPLGREKIPRLGWWEVDDSASTYRGEQILQILSDNVYQ